MPMIEDCAAFAPDDDFSFTFASCVPPVCAVLDECNSKLEGGVSTL